MPDHSDIGTRLRTIRKRRGLTQKELASSSGVSLSLIRKLEQGEIRDTRMETAHRLAVTLRVQTTDLLRRLEPDGTPPPQPWTPLQQAVERPAAQPDEPATVDGIQRGLKQVLAAHEDKRMRDEVAILAPLLRDADALVDADDPESRRVRAHLLHAAGSTLTQVRAFGAAETALRRALDDAPDRTRAARVVTTWAWLLVRQGRFAEARELAQRWADDVEPRFSRATTEELAAWGWLLLQGAAAGMRDNRPGEAESMLRLARAAAVATGRVRASGVLAAWGPETVAYKTAERNVILDRPEAVLAAGERLKRVSPAPGTTYYRHRLDVARAHVMTKQYGQAVDVLTEVHREAPEWLPQQHYARDILSDVIAKRRTLTPEMRSLSDAIALPL